ncbi:hypothetical protein SCUCBS95973_003432 [Sporothrix curviconia]|uniref:C6 zinc finger domain containing protein n=1 Tax=Sporothrix curviconia TaxID=1260050 RepID=A0ABP0BF63_9PEZI
MSGAGRARLPDAPAPGLFQVISLGGDNSGGGSNNNNNNHIREYKRRRPHKKTRSGCLACKQRRVKRPCVYEGTEGAAAPGPRLKVEQTDESQEPITAPLATEVVKVNRLATIRSKAKREQSLHVQGNNNYYSQGAAPAGFHTFHTQRDIVVSSAPPVPQIPPARLVRPHPFEVTGQELGTPANELLYHFEVTGATLFGMPNFMGPIFPLALQFPHLRGTALASAAAHLTHKASGFRNYHLAKHYQQSIALNAYQKALSTPFAALGQLGVDVLLMTAMLMNMLSFVMPLDENESRIVWDGSTPGPAPPCADPDPDPRRSWVFSTHPNRLGWLALQMGLTPLLIATAPWREKSRLRLLFANSDDEQRTLSGTWQSLRHVPQVWLDLFGMDRHAAPRPNYRGSGVTSRAPSGPPSEPSQRSYASQSQSIEEDTDMDAADSMRQPSISLRSGQSTPAIVSGPGTPASTCSNNTASTSTTSSSGGSTIENTMSEADRIYRAPLRVIAELRLIEPNERSMLQYFQFIGQLDNDFRQKLYERDEKALWIFGMWMGLLCRFDNVWWTRRRTRCDFRAIRLWLHLVGVAQRPGREGQIWQQLLQDMDDTWGYNFATDPIMHCM